MLNKFEGAPEGEAKEKVLLADEEESYLKALVKNMHAQSRPGSSSESKSGHELRESLLSKFE